MLKYYKTLIIINRAASAQSAHAIHLGATLEPVDREPPKHPDRASEDHDPEHPEPRLADAALLQLDARPAAPAHAGAQFELFAKASNF